MTTSRTILLVEDDPCIRRAADMALRRAGHRVVSAADGEEGLRRALVDQPDLVLLDLLMPKLSGLDVLRAMRAHDATRTTPVLVVSNSSSGRTVAEVHGLGAEYFIKSNVSLRELLERVQGMLERAPAVAR